MIYFILLFGLLILICVGALMYEFVWVAKPSDSSSAQLWYVVGRRVDASVLFRVFYCTSADKALEMWGEECEDWKIILVTTDYEKVKNKRWPVLH